MRLRMRPKETELWSRQRTRGRLRFVLVKGVLLFGGLSLALEAAMLSFTPYFQPVFSRLLLVLGVFALMGAVFGLLGWEIFEFWFRHTHRGSDDDHPEHPR